jgi:hypothetical protein
MVDRVGAGCELSGRMRARAVQAASCGTQILSPEAQGLPLRSQSSSPGFGPFPRARNEMVSILPGAYTWSEQIGQWTFLCFLLWITASCCVRGSEG